ncbi:MAG: acyltransferase [Candidatus Lokiarchaeota archaeon]|nr:acyltransferase [Candidatus Lokiarchaeota archaeon]
MTKKKLPELDILRIVSILIVIIFVHMKDYGYSFYVEVNQYYIYFFNGLGIFVAMGSMVFLSGFGLFLNKDNRNIDSTGKLITFLKKRFLRIFPLYWIAIPLFVVFLGYFDIDFLYLLAHIMGMQIIVAPIFGPPMLTLWFIGIIVVYYLIFIILSYLGSIKKIIPAAIVILIIFVFLNVTFGFVEYRFFYYYFFFIAGIVIANIYTSQFYIRVKESFNKRSKLIPLIIAGCSAFLFYLIYQFLAEFSYSFFTLEYGTFILSFILDMNPGFLQSAMAVILTNLIIIVYIIFTVSLFYLFIHIFRLIIPKIKLDSIFSRIAYSTFCVYLFHRIFLIIYVAILTYGLNIDTFNKDNVYLVYLFIPFIFLFSYFIQKLYDLIIKTIFRESQKVPKIEKDS